MLLHAKELTGSFVVAIIFYTFVTALLLSPLIRTNTINVLTSKALSDRVASISKKYAKNPNTRNAELFELSTNYGIAVVSFPLSYILKVLLGFFMTLGFRLPEIAAMDTTLSGFDLSKKTYMVFKETGFSFPLVVLIIFACVVEIAYDADALDDFIVDLTGIYTVKRIISFVLVLVFPCAFLIYWIGFLIIELLVMAYVTRWRVDHYIEKLKAQLKRKGKSI